MEQRNVYRAWSVKLIEEVAHEKPVIDLENKN